jgi:hypothetical protein
MSIVMCHVSEQNTKSYTRYVLGCFNVDSCRLIPEHCLDILDPIDHYHSYLLRR